MKFMIPLGFIAILSVAILVVIYLIKPSYKSRTLPSTYIWKESLKYRKKDKKSFISGYWGTYEFNLCTAR